MSSTRDRRWWSVPKTFSGFSLWRLTNPFLDTVDNTNDNKANSRKDDEQDDEEEEMKQNKFCSGDNIVDDDKENKVDSELNHEKLKKLRRSRSRSRSSSLSRKSVERSSVSIDMSERKDDKQQLSNSSNSSSAAALPEISFSFYNEKEDEYIIIEPAVIVKQKRKDSIVVVDETDDKRKSEITIDLDGIETKVTNEEEEEEREEEDDISVHDSRLRQVVDNEVDDSCQAGETRHVSSITLAVRSSANYTNTDELKSITDSFISAEAVKENDYEALREESTTDCFTSRKDSLSSSASFPIYAIIDKNHNDDDNNRSSTLPSSLGVGNNETVPELPNPDWEETNSDDNPDYAEITTPVDNHSLEAEGNKLYADQNHVVEVGDVRKEDGTDEKGQYEDMEYCQHRAELKPSKRRVTLLRNRKRPSIGKVRLRINRTWMRVKCWWLEERVKIGEVISRHSKSENNEDVCYAENVETADKEDNRISPVVYVIQEEAVTRDTGDRGTTAGEQQQLPETITEQDDENDDYVDLKSDGGDSSHIASTVSTMRAVKRRKSSNNNAIGSPLPALSRSSSIAAFRRSRFIPAGQNGFEELRRYIKQGGDFCKELSAILQERSEAETQYAKTLSKLSCKLIKATKEAVNTVNTAWQRTAVEMEAQSEVHRAFATALSEEVVKPLKQLVESQHRIRKSVETAVDKTGKSLAEWRSAECKSKKQSFLSARENEKMQDAMLDVRIAGGGGGMQNHHTGNKLSTSTLHLHNQKVVSDKENAKMESKRRKAEESVKKADVEYYTYCIRAERARLEWESAILRGSHCFQALEEERLQHLKDLASCYLHHYKEMGPKLVQSACRLTEPMTQINIVGDLDTVVSLREAGQPLPEQLLPDFYAEHITLAMNKERRRQALVKLLHLIRQDIERERRGKQGVENLARALKQTPNFGAEDSQQNVTEKLHHMRSMLAYLEAARYKVQSALAELEGRTKESHPLSPHIHITRDRQGLQQSILKVPTWVRKESIDLADSPDWTDRGAADGNSVQPDSDFDEFSSQGSEHDYQSSVLSQFPVLQEEAPTPQTTVTTTTVSASRCKAIYHYAANLYDELNLSPGDVINIHDKQEDGWWLGELNGVVGIFPATYVEEIK